MWEWNSVFDIFIVMRKMVGLQRITYVYNDYNQYKINHHGSWTNVVTN